ncbi:MAG: tetratricopeptide repeat protein [Verrucomicrobiota bacterium]
MSRFGNLEFDDDSSAQLVPRQAHSDEAEHLEKAQNALASGRFELALRCYAKVLEFNPRNAAAWTGQVRMLVELGEFDEARLWADKALEQFPREPELLAAKGVALARLGDTAAGLAFSDAAIEERGDTPYVWVARGDVLLAREEKRAQYCFEKALQIAANHWLCAWLISRVHYYYSQFALALKYAQQALAANATQAVVWLQTGNCQLALGLADIARNSFEQARQLDPACMEARQGIAQASQAPGSGFKNWWRRLFRS